MMLLAISIEYWPFLPLMANFILKDKSTMFNKENNVLRSIPAVIFISIKVNTPEHNIPMAPVIR